MTSSVNADIFREYDIRGIADADLGDGVVEEIARAFVAHLGQAEAVTVTVGHDARLSSPRLRDALIRGLTVAGATAVDLGLCPTPALYFSLHKLRPAAGIMVTGSHNPPKFNGLKLCVGTRTIHGAEIQRIRSIIEEGTGPSGRERGRATSHPIMAEYRDDLAGRFPEHRDVPVSVVVDSGNGTGGLAAPAVLRSLGCEVHELYSEPDGRFPNHHPDPTVPKNLNALIAAVREKKADLGIGFDGDADRIGVVDEQGTVIWGDQLMVLFSRDILKERPGATIVSEVKCSQVMYDDIRARGGNAVMWKAGHSLIKAKMKELSAVLGGEMSGHIFFADRFPGYDDAIYAACRVVELLRRARRDGQRRVALSSLLADLPRTVSTPEIRFDCPDRIKFQVVDRVRDLYGSGRDLPLRPREVITVDGIRAVFETGWGLLRASNTQPVLVMRFEAEDQASLDAIRAVIEQQVGDSIKALAT
jgi:phosphomannomutase/phosphoglucomutase